MRGASRAVSRGIGQGVFTPTATPTCPAGQHWVPDAAPPIRGLGQIGKCVPNTVLHLNLRPPPAPAPPIPPAVSVQVPQSFQRPIPIPTAPDAAPAPASPPGLVCPPPYPWWYLLIAAGLGGALGFYAQRNQKAVRRNARRAASHAGHRIVHRASDAAIARLLR